MPIIAKETATMNYEQIATWTYPARCIKVIDLWTVEFEYMWEKKTKREIMVTFEFPTETKVFEEEKWEQPFTLSAYFTLSLSEKSKLRKFLETWRWKSFTKEELDGFDVAKLVWVPALVSIVEVTNKQWNKRNVIWSATTLPKGMEVPEQINESLIFSLAPDDFDSEIFDKLSEKMQEKIKETREYKALFMGL